MIDEYFSVLGPILRKDSETSTHFRHIMESLLPIGPNYHCCSQPLNCATWLFKYMLVLKSLIQLNPTLGVESSLGKGKGRPLFFFLITSLNSMLGLEKRKTQLYSLLCWFVSMTSCCRHRPQSSNLRPLRIYWIPWWNLVLRSCGNGTNKYVKMKRA